MPYLQRSRERYIFYAMMLFVLAVTLIKSIALPSPWAQSHWLITYDIGFRRALPGTVLNSLGLYSTPESAQHVIILGSFFWFVALMLALLWVVWRIFMRTRWHIPYLLYAVLFLTSSFIVVSGAIIGIFDQVFHVGTIVAIWLLLRKQFLASTILISAMLLVHESVIAVGFPMLVLALVLSHKLRSWQSALILAGPLAVFVALTLVQSTYNNLNTYDLLFERLYAFPFTEVEENVIVIGPEAVSDDASEIRYALPFTYSMSFSESFNRQRPLFLMRLLDPDLGLRAYPFVFISLMMLMYSFGTKLKRWYLLLIVLCIVTPLALHLVAWDAQRIWMYTIFNAFLAVWICVEIYEFDSVPATPITTAFFLAIMFHTYGETPLFPDHMERDSFAVRLLQTLAVILLFYTLFAIKPLRGFIFEDSFLFSRAADLSSTE